MGMGIKQHIKQARIVVFTASLFVAFAAAPAAYADVTTACSQYNGDVKTACEQGYGGTSCGAYSGSQRVACDAGKTQAQTDAQNNNNNGNNTNNQNNTGNTSGNGSGECGGTKTGIVTCGEPSGLQAIGSLIKMAVTGLTILIGIVAVGGLTYAAIIYASARDNSSQTQQSIGIIRNIVIGLLLYGFTIAIINWLVPGGVIG